MTMRMLPPVGVVYQRREVNGRTYSAAPGTVVDVPDQDGTMLSANGWIAVCPVGTTAQRPTGTADPNSPTPGTLFLDVTLGALIVFDGATWRSPVDGAAV